MRATSTWFITGCSTGLGRNLAEAVLTDGHSVVVAARDATNLFGPIAMIKAVLPGMRSRRNGVIVNISSISAQICPPGSSYYAASKAALEAISSSLRKEVARPGSA